VGRPEGLRSPHASDDDPEAFQEPRGLVQLRKRLIQEFGLPERTQLVKEETQTTLTEDQRACAGELTAEDEALPPELFRPAEANALRVLDATKT
jgi:hypothetical protein